MSQHTLAAHFRQLHTRTAQSPVVLVNAWDAMSARLVEAAGAQAIATTSAGISWGLGFPDGQGLTRDMMIDAVRRIVAAVRIPVTADVESGYGTGTPDDIAATVLAVANAGAVGVNLEDSPGANGAPLVDSAMQAARLAAGRAAATAAGVDVFINARVDVFLKQVGDESGRFDETVRRANAYVAAGADGIFVPGVTNPDVIRALAATIGAPLNVLAMPGAPTIAEMRELGVARASVGPGLARSVMAFMRRAATEVLVDGTYESIRDQVPSPEANKLFGSRD